MWIVFLLSLLAFVRMRSRWPLAHSFVDRPDEGLTGGKEGEGERGRDEASAESGLLALMEAGSRRCVETARFRVGLG